MVKRGEVYENPVTGERVIVLVGTAETDGSRLVVDLYLRPGSRVAASHYHPIIHERFSVLRGVATTGGMLPTRRRRSAWR